MVKGMQLLYSTGIAQMVSKITGFIAFVGRCLYLSDSEVP